MPALLWALDLCGDKKKLGTFSACGTARWSTLVPPPPQCTGFLQSLAPAPLFTLNGFLLFGKIKKNNFVYLFPLLLGLLLVFN